MRCELLSKIIIFVMKDNSFYFNKRTERVVNCFQKLLSSWWRTTSIVSVLVACPLWIAFKNYYLRDEGQQYLYIYAINLRCELLSKIIIFVMKDNRLCFGLCFHYVVNCFQKLLSSWWRTTHEYFCYPDFSLWIAFKNYYLRDEGQPDLQYSYWGQSCELLSKIIIFVMKDNLILPFSITLGVVNCFQKLLSSWWRTTYIFISCVNHTLWIAFKNYYLRDEGQQ